MVLHKNRNGPTLTYIHNYWKGLALTIQTFVTKVMSLFFKTLSMFVIAFLPKSNCLLISLEIRGSMRKNPHNIWP